MCWTEGRIDFAALQRRLYPGASRAQQLSVELPAAYVAFDLLAVDGTDIRPKPYSARRTLLKALLARQLPHGLVLMPTTVDFAVAQTWMLNHTSAGVEGVVAKRLNHPYRANGRTWVKIRTRRTAEAVIGGVLGSLEQPEALILGRPDHRGHLGCPSSRPAGSGTWQARPSSTCRSPRPRLVELDVDVSFENHRWRHGARFIRIRPDLQRATSPRHHHLDRLTPSQCEGVQPVPRRRR